MEIKLVGFLADWCPAAAAFLPSDCCRLAGRAAHAVSWLALSVSSGLECYFHPKPAVLSAPVAGNLPWQMLVLFYLVQVCQKEEQKSKTPQLGDAAQLQAVPALWL